jgi:hypothetical protein
MKTEVITFVAGYLTKALVTATIGEAFIKPFVRQMSIEIAQLPRVVHYIQSHRGRSFNCHDCLLGTPIKVDAISGE